jgi:hypothetical protein
MFNKTHHRKMNLVCQDLLNGVRKLSITIQDIIHRPAFVKKETRRFEHWILSRSSGGTYSGGSNRKTKRKHYISNPNVCVVVRPMNVVIEFTFGSFIFTVSYFTTLLVSMTTCVV